MPASRDALFTRVERGESRERTLEAFRNSLRELIDPSTGEIWDEDTIRQATIESSRFWVEAESDDLIVQAAQKKAEFLAQQVDPRRASTYWLDNYHGPSLKAPRLGASGGAGYVSVTATPGTVFVGSTSIPDTLATRAKNRAGLRFQVLFNQVVPASGTAMVFIQGIDVGPETNLSEGDPIEWENPPPGAGQNDSAAEDFTGGTLRETDSEYGERLFVLKGQRPKNGNPAHFRAWTREATNAVEDAAVYPCALDAGSVLICVSQKRGGVLGPLARIPSISTLTIVSGRVVPPASPVVAARAYVLPVPPIPVSCNAALGLPLKKGVSYGWADPAPWPRFNTLTSTIQSLTSQTVFRINSDVSLPTTGTPQLMVWNSSTSRFEKLIVASVVFISGTTYEVTLAVEPSFTIVVSDYISPYTPRHEAIAKGVEAYFDSLGPNEAFDLETDARAGRAYRRPRPERERPYNVDSSVIDYIEDSMGTRFFGEIVHAMSPTVPGINVNLATGVNMLVAGRFAVYPAE